MLSVQKIFCVVALVVFACGVASETECKGWLDQNGPKVASSQPLTANLMAFKPAKSSNTRLAKRIDSQSDTIAIAPGTGACGQEYSSDAFVVCGWNGNQGDNPSATAGWLNRNNLANCGKKITLKTADGTSVQASILDGCPMNIAAGNLDEGCRNLYATQGTLNALGANNADRVKLASWKFDSPPE